MGTPGCAYTGLSICGGKEVVVAVEIDTAGELLAVRTTFLSCCPDSSHKSTVRRKNVASISLRTWSATK